MPRGRGGYTRIDPVERAGEGLYGVPLGRFLEERALVARRLEEAGDPVTASRVLQLRPPTVAAWVVNQLWRESRADLAKLLLDGRRRKEGKPVPPEQYRELLARLEAHARKVLVPLRHADDPAILHRVVRTLESLAAEGSFGSDPPGQLKDERGVAGPALSARMFSALPSLPASPLPGEAARRESPARLRERMIEQTLEQRRIRTRVRAVLGARVSTIERRVASLREEIERAEAGLHRKREELALAERELASARRELDGD